MARVVRYNSVTKVAPGLVQVAVNCPGCSDENYVTVPEQSLKDWMAGIGNIQMQLPFLNDSERELLMTGMCQKCWDKLREPVS